MSRYLICVCSFLAVSLLSLHSESTYSTWYIPNLFPVVSLGSATFLYLPNIIYDTRKTSISTCLFELSSSWNHAPWNVYNIYNTCLHWSHVIILTSRNTPPQHRYGTQLSHPFSAVTSITPTTGPLGKAQQSNTEVGCSLMSWQWYMHDANTSLQRFRWASIPQRCGFQQTRRSSRFKDWLSSWLWSH